MKSMRVRLFMILLATTGVVWLSAVAWILVSTRAQVERVLDARLMEAANMVSSLLVEQDVSLARAANLPAKQLARPVSYQRQLSCQIWSFAGSLISKSDDAPNGQLSPIKTGFSEATVDGESWRVYAVENRDLGIRVFVGDTRRIRDELVGDVVKGLLLPALLIMPLLAVLIWLSVKGGLEPLRQVAAALGARSASNLSPVPADAAARELAPLLAALNGLFKRVADARERERNFTTFAAHELRTPLAGLKTQAQVALASADADIKEHALSQIVQGVNRTGRLVRQLLDLAAVEAHENGPAAGRVNPGHAIAMLQKDFLAQPALAPRVVIEPELAAIELEVDADLFSLAARNLLENALLHSPARGVVRCRLVTEESATLTVSIEDSGPGIPDEEIPRVTERFYRGHHKAPVGSGLGLSIAQLAIAQAGGALALRNRAAGGLAACMVFPRALGRRCDRRAHEVIACA